MIVDPSPTDAVMADEIFGPILPVLTVESLDSAVEFVNGRPKPLALYVFSQSRLRGTDTDRSDSVRRCGGQPRGDALPGAVSCPSAGSAPAGWAPTTAGGASKR